MGHSYASQYSDANNQRKMFPVFYLFWLKKLLLLIINNNFFLLLRLKRDRIGTRENGVAVLIIQTTKMDALIKLIFFFQKIVILPRTMLFKKKKKKKKRSYNYSLKFILSFFNEHASKCSCYRTGFKKLLP